MASRTRPGFFFVGFVLFLVLPFLWAKATNGPVWGKPLFFCLVAALVALYLAIIGRRAVRSLKR